VPETTIPSTQFHCNVYEIPSITDLLWENVFFLNTVWKQHTATNSDIYNYYYYY